MKDWKAILVNGLASSLTTKVLLAPLGIVPAMLIGTVVYEIDPFKNGKPFIMNAHKKAKAFIMNAPKDDSNADDS